MTNQSISLALVVVLLCPFSSAQSRQPNTQKLGVYSDIPAGPVNGIWTRAGSPYNVTGEIRVPNDSTLTIEPGVEVVFMGHYKFNVQGRLLAVGTQQDTIRFTAENTETGWHGIRFESTPNTNDTSRISYCSFKYGNANTGSGLDRCGGGMLISRFDKIVVSNCLFDSNMQSGAGWSPPEGGPAIYAYYASPIVTNSTFTNNSGSKGSAVGCVTCPNAITSNNVFLNNCGAFGAIVYVSNSNGIISGNIISNNVATWGGGGILIDNALVGGSSSPRVENNIIIHNKAPIGGGIYCLTNANPVLINNTIAYNSATSGGGIYCENNSDGISINSILFGNTATTGNQVFVNDAGSDPIFEYCDVQGGKEGFGGYGAGANYTGRYDNNIDKDPSFMNSDSGDYRLSNASPSIGAGVDSIEISGVWYHVPPYCFGGNARPTPTGSMPDIGAFENPLGFSGVDDLPEALPPSFALHQNYPNPFNPSTTIKYELPKSSMVRLGVFDMLGREVSLLVDERRDPGVHEVKFDVWGLSSGVYFYRLQAGDFVKSKNLILLK
jgi:parallel beta-helix repeat protein